MRRRLAWLASLGVSGIAGVACTTLLGDFSVGTAHGHKDGGDASPQDDGALPLDDAALDATDGPIHVSDATMTNDAADSGDAPDDGDAGRLGDAAAEGGLPQLACTTWRWPQPIIVEDLATKTAHRFGGRYAAFPAQLDQVRIVASKFGPPTYSVYTVTKSTMLVQQIDGSPPGLAFVADIRHVPSAIGGTTAVVIHESPISPPGSYYVVAFNDLMPANGPLPAQFTLFSQSFQQSPPTIHVIPLSATDIFEAVSLGTGSPPTYNFGVARVSPQAPSSVSTLSPVATSVNAADFAEPRMLHANGNVYISDINDISTPGCTGWTVPDTATFTTMPPKQTIASGVSLGVYDLAPHSASAAANILTMEETYAGQFTSAIRFSVGVVPYASLDSWTAASLTPVRRTTNPFAAPVGVLPNASWFGDDIMLIGPGVRNGLDGGTAPGLNLLWVHASGAIRCDQTGTSEILNDRGGFSMANAVPARITPNFAAWDIVWVESIVDADGGTHDVMKMNELICQ